MDSLPLYEELDNRFKSTWTHCCWSDLTYNLTILANKLTTVRLVRCNNDMIYNNVSEEQITTQEHHHVDI